MARGWALLETGAHAEAMAEFEAASRHSDRAPEALAGIAATHARLGRPSDARAGLAEFQELSSRRHVPAFLIALVQVALGERDLAFQALDRALDQRTH